jgi:competence ComEA-like helix-hairpin-helix protein
VNKSGKAIALVEEALQALQTRKPFSVSTAVRKLEVVAELIGDTKLKAWCHSNLGHRRQLLPDKEDGEDVGKYVDRLRPILAANGMAFQPTEMLARIDKSGGGFESIEFIEDRYEHIKKLKHGNDGTYYLSNLGTTITEVANSAGRAASRLYSTLGFSDLPRQHFDAIRERVNRLLLDICPEAVEQFMAAYERLGGRNSEDWSLALTACRRVIKTVADSVYPPTEEEVGGRKLGDPQYINRLWAYLDKTVAASSDKDLAKAHVDYLGTFLSRLNDKASKGVHTSVSRTEAIQTVMYTYLTLGDLLELAPPTDRTKLTKGKKIDLNSASLDELAAVPGLSRESAKTIVIRRAAKPFATVEELRELDGIGPKTFDRLAASLVVFPLKGGEDV